MQVTLLPGQAIMNHPHRSFGGPYSQLAQIAEISEPAK